MQLSRCRLCNRKSILKESHIIPKFVGKHIKNTSPTGGLRAAGEINKRIQDLPKIKLLCGNCELKFSKWETLFSKNVHFPYQRNWQLNKLKYDSWLLKFAVSLIWRVGVTQINLPTIWGELSQMQKQKLKEALAVWKRYLNGTDNDPGNMEIHILFFSPIVEDYGMDLPININSYLLRGVDQSIVYSKRGELGILVKLPAILFVANINPNSNPNWIGTKIDKSGMINFPQRFVFDEIFNYLVKQSREVMSASAGMSSEQAGKLAKAVLEDKTKAKRSLSYKALKANKKLFESKFSKKYRKGRNEPCPCGSGKKYKKCCYLRGRYY